ncbi:hypothetical protein [Haloplanus salinarum]|uniref:FG-GAP repeat protein n=1 Tax=Haloplanus salinarum TaxID=1912324 RepID=UPI003B431C39
MITATILERKILTITITADDGDGGDHFGDAVALSEGTALIGANRDEDPKGGGAGSAYVFSQDGDSWTQQTKLFADDGAGGDRFGRSVALAGGTALVGAPGDDSTGGHRAGSAYVFTQTNNEWTQEAKLTADDRDKQDYFGGSVAIAGDTALVGAQWDEDPNGDSAGSAYVFTRTDGEWSQQAKLIPDDGDSDDTFGQSVTLSMDTALIGAPADEDPAGQWSGSAYVFTQADGEWSQQAKLTAKDSTEGDYFGSVALDNGLAVVGAPGDSSIAYYSGAAHIFEGESGGNDGSQGGTEPSSGFDPTIHGFGFQNWGGEGVFEPPHNHETIVEEAFKTQFDQEWTPKLRQNASFPMPTEVVDALSDALFETLQNGPEALYSGGHCYGMCLTAQQYFEEGLPETLPPDTTATAEISKPTGEYGSVGGKIDELHRQQALEWDVFKRAQFVSPPSQQNEQPIDAEEEVRAIRSAINETGTALVGVGSSPSVFPDATLLHQLVGYNVEVDGQSLESSQSAFVDVYNPNYAAENYEDNIQRLEIDISQPTKQPIENEGVNGPGYQSVYHRFAFIGPERTALLKMEDSGRITP